MAGKILVIGSSNVDLIVKVPRFHDPGETILGEDLVTAFGGKGANQALAAKHLGARVAFGTKLGNDLYGRSYLRYLIRTGLDRKYLLRDRSLPTGIAIIELNPRGENRIIVSAGANGSLLPGDLERMAKAGAFKGARALLTQLEIPLPTVERALKMARDRGMVNLLNPSPPIVLPPEMFALIDFLVPNEWEAQFHTGIRVKGQRDLTGIAQKLLDRGTRNVVITLGAKGLYAKNREEEFRLPAFPVRVLDTTAAGDAFMGALAVGLCEGKPLGEVLRWSSGAGALAATRLGAQPSLPRRRELERFLREGS